MAMERTRIAKVEDVTLSRRGEHTTGTLHLTPHHLIFVSNPPAPSPNVSRQTEIEKNKVAVSKPRELWITYPMIHFCTFRPSPTASRQPSSIRLRCRDFSFVCFYFPDERKARDAYESIKIFTCKLGRIEKLYAFSYAPKGPEGNITKNDGGGWSVYDPMREWRRQGVDKNKNWRISKINKDYTFSETYPATMAVPSAISDSTLNYAKPYRSRHRIPALTYLHPVNNCTITRCSQPLVGVRGNRSIQDEKLMAAIFNTTRAGRPLSGFATPPPERADTEAEPPPAPPLEGEVSNPEALEDAVISQLRRDGEFDNDEGSDEKKPRIYGAQQRNMIIDARPTINAMAMTAMGAGSENMDNYKFAAKAYLGIDNIHVMRDSLQKVIDALKDSDLTPLGPNREALHHSKWLKHIANVMDGVGLIARQVGLQHSHVLIHCSDGWDRTSQLSALSQICLDPYYRTMEGFIVLVEKDWVSFGHRFRYRGGPLGSEKWFQIENERVSARNEDDDRDDEKDRGRAAEAFQGAQKSLGNAFLSAKGWFKQDNESRENLALDSENETSTIDGQPAKRVVSASGRDDKSVTKVKEISPIFHQFLDATYQLLHQYPTRFEFSERFLRRLLYHLYSCQYGTFLFDNEKDRKEAKISERTRSVWDYFLSRKNEFVNSKYDPTVDDNVRGKERLIFPRVEEVRWWHELFGRTDEEMNGGLFTKHSTAGGVSTSGAPTKASNGASDADSEMSSYGMQSQVSVSVPVSRARTPVLTGVETAEVAVGVAASPAKVEAIPDQQKLTEAVADVLPVPVPVPVAVESGAEEAKQDGANVEILEPTLAAAAEQPRVVQQPGTARVISVPSSPGGSSPEQQHHQHQIQAAERLIDSTTQQQALVKEDGDAVMALTDGLDPLGIGDVKDHVSTSKNKALEGRERRRAQMDALLQ